MKRLALALTAVAAFTGSALAADMAPRTYTKAPAVVAPVASWTGCYIGGGGGGAMTNNDHSEFVEERDRRCNTQRNSPNLTTGARGWFGTVGAGCDYQFNKYFVVGVFGDYDFMSVKGDIRGSTGSGARW